MALKLWQFEFWTSNKTECIKKALLYHHLSQNGQRINAVFDKPERDDKSNKAETKAQSIVNATLMKFSDLSSSEVLAAQEIRPHACARAAESNRRHFTQKTVSASCFCSAFAHFVL